jgi:hypothetical protein
MADGRIFTSYTGSCGQYAEFVSRTGAKSSFEARRNMIADADALIERDRKNAFLRARCEPCFAFDEAGTMLPENSKVTCNASFCEVSYAPPGVGLGQGRSASHPAAGLVGTDVMLYPIQGSPSNVYDKYSSPDGVTRIA